jgi:hypothetical protein
MGNIILNKGSLDARAIGIIPGYRQGKGDKTNQY